METRAIAYMRVSTEKQADGGISLDAQRSMISAYADLYKLQVIEFVEDVQTAKTLDRPGLQRALELLETGTADALIITKLDRLTRRVIDLGVLIETYFGSEDQWALLSVSEQIDTRSAMGRLVLNILASVAQWEREIISERTVTALREMKRQRLRTGSIPYGWTLGDDGATLVENVTEQHVLTLVKQAYAERRTLNEIAGALAHHGFKSRTGRPFDTTQVRRMLVPETEWRKRHPKREASRKKVRPR